MSGQPSAKVEAAARMVLRGHSRAEAAKRYGVALSSIRRALARVDVSPLPVGRPPK